MAIYRGAGGASDSVDDATVNAVAAYAASAANSATASATSASEAAVSATSASGSVASVATYASNAATSATNASASASLASVSSTEADGFAGAASASAVAAAASASDASNSASNADTSEANAASSASSASTSASNAASSAASALAIYGNTTAMNNAVAAAANSASNAATSASNASTSASTATTQASNALSSANAADISEAAALTYSNNAATSANNALNSQAAAAASAASAATSAASASTSATNSASIYGGLSAVNAAVATTTTNANNAATSATNAANSATQAAASAASASAIVLGVSSGLPSIRPSLNLDFANSATVDPRITFTRASTATYYDGKTTAKAEENLLTYSQEFDNAAWLKFSTAVTGNTTVAPDGTNTGDTLTASAASATHSIQATNTSVAGTQRSLSVYVKAGSSTFVQLLFGVDLNAFANFDVGTGVVGTVGSAVTASITSIGSGWYRCVIVTSSVTATSSVFVAMVTSAAAARYESWTALGTETVYLWGAQLEQRSSVTAYTPTTTAPITNYIPVLQTAASGVPRLDYDPVTFEAKGLLIEEQRTNLFTYSSEFDTAAWTKTAATVTANTVVAPDGTLTADKLIDDSTNSEHRVRVTGISKTANQVLTYSLYVKPAGRYLVMSMEFSGVGLYTIFDVLNNQYSDFAAAGGWTRGTTSVTTVGNGWYKCVISGTTDTSVTVNIRAGLSNVYPSAGVQNPVYTGDGYSGVYIWGAQLEAGSFATSYIPTTSAQVTRAADSASMTGTNFSSWYRADEGSFYAEYATLALTTAACVISQNVSNREFLFGGSGGVNSAARTIDNTNGVLVSTNAFIGAGNPVKGAMLYGSSSRSIVAMGNTPTTGAYDGVYMSATILYIGKASSATNTLNGHIKRIAYYPKRLTNTELQALTA